jgi:hypothetical protein
MPKLNQHRCANRTQKGWGAEPVKNPNTGCRGSWPGWQVN